MLVVCQGSISRCSSDCDPAAVGVFCPSGSWWAKKFPQLSESLSAVYWKCLAGVALTSPERPSTIRRHHKNAFLIGWVGSLDFTPPAAAVAVCYQIRPEQVLPKQPMLPPNKQGNKFSSWWNSLPRALMEALDFLQTLMSATQAPVWMELPALMASTLSNAYAFPATEGTCVRSVRPTRLQLILLTASLPPSSPIPRKLSPAAPITLANL